MVTTFSRNSSDVGTSNTEEPVLLKLCKLYCNCGVGYAVLSFAVSMFMFVLCFLSVCMLYSYLDRP